MSEEIQCGRCGCDVERVLCERCGGVGQTAPGELHDEDPLWYDDGDVEQCNDCQGVGGWWRCCNSADWCEAHPMPGREKVSGGTLERLGGDAS